MKLTTEENTSLEEPHVLVEYAEIDEETRSIFFALNSIGKELLGKRGKELVRIPVNDTLYCESVDGRAFIYTSNEVVESALRLSEIEIRLHNTAFVRGSRTMLANLDRVSSIRPFPNARLQLQMDNGEYITVSRQYAPDIKSKLGL